MTALALSSQPVSFGSPFSGGVTRLVLPLGLTIAEIAARIPSLPRDFHRHGTVCVDGEPVDRFTRWNGQVVDRWQAIRPKPRADGVARVTFHLGVQGKGLRSIGVLVASIALVAVSAAISAGALGPAGLGIAGSFFAAGSTSATLLAAGASILGRFAITALAPAPAQQRDKSAADLGNAGADGNTLQPGGPIPRCCGEIKIHPPLASFPLVDLSGDDEFVEAAYVLAGAHQLRDLRVENAPVDEVDGLQYVTDDGTSNSPASLLSRYGRQRLVQVELKAHQRDNDNIVKLRSQDNPETSLPAWRTEVSSVDPDEMWFHLVWPQGMGEQVGGTPVAMPFRLRMRTLGGSDWINLPQLMFRHKKPGAIRKFIKLKWGTPPVLATSGNVFGAWEAFHTVPAGNIALRPGTDAWAADASFVGTPGVYNATARVDRAYDGFTIWLDPAVFPRGFAWETQIKRGCIVKTSDFTPATYEYQVPGAILPLFDFILNSSGALVPATATYTETIVETCTLTRFASVWNNPPLPEPGNAKIEIRAKNVQVTRVSCLASGLIPLWNGSEWTGLGTSSNPADHYRDVLAGQLTRDPVETDIQDNANLLAWRAECVSAGWTIAAAFDGRNWRETLSAIAACGKARRKEGPLWGVSFERDRSGETGVQAVTPRNARNFTLIKSFEEPPQAIRITFRNRLKDWEPDERLVVRPGVALEEVTDIGQADAIGLVTPAEVDAHFHFNLASAAARDHLVECDVHLDHLVSEPGDLVSVSHLVLSRQLATARIASVETDGSGDITAIVIDTAKAMAGGDAVEDVAAVEAIAEVSDQGVALGIAIRTGTGTVMAELANAPGKATRLALATPLDAPEIKTGNLVMIGPSEMRVERYLVQDWRATRRFDARLTLIPEAPELFA